jgi:outer membrane protein assembly factor BamA
MRCLLLISLLNLLCLDSVLAQNYNLLIHLLNGSQINLKLSTSDSDSSKAAVVVSETLTESGYYGFRIDSIRTSADQTSVWVNEGKVYQIGKVQVDLGNGDSSWVEKSYSGLAATKENILTLSDKLLLDFEEQGYASASVFVDHVQVDEKENRLNLLLAINPGDRYVFAGIIDKTDGVLSARYLERVVDTRVGDAISPEVLRKIETNLAQTEAFKTTYEPSLSVREGEAMVVIDYPARKLNSFDALIGYVPQQQNGEGAVVGNVNLRIRNIGIPGSSTHLRFDRLQPFVTKFWLDYDADWLFGAPFRFKTNINFIQQDSTYLVRNFGLQSELRVGMYHFLGLGFRNESAFSGTRVLEEGTFARVLDASRWMFGVSYRYRNVDSPVNPTRGFLFTMNADNGRKQITDASVNPDSVSTVWRQILFRTSGQTFIPTFERQTIAVGVHFYLMDSPHYLEDDLVRFGGALSLRGFNEDQFFASRMFWTDVEYRLLLDQESYGFVFGAYGNYERPRYFTEPEAISAVNEHLISYGLGFSYQTRAGRLLFTYALSQRDGFSNGKVHVGIVGNL